MTIFKSIRVYTCNFNSVINIFNYNWFYRFIAARYFSCLKIIINLSALSIKRFIFSYNSYGTYWINISVRRWRFNICFSCWNSNNNSIFINRRNRRVIWFPYNAFICRTWRHYNCCKLYAVIFYNFNFISIYYNA